MARRLCLVSVLVLLLSACVAPSSVKQYADTTKQTIERAKPVVKDYVDDCGDRQLPLLHSDATQEKWQCKDVAKLAGPFNTMADFISAYADALSALSASEGVKYKGQTADVVGAAENLPGFANDKVRIDAVGALSDLMLHWAEEGYREKKIRQALDASNAQIVDVSAAIADFMTEISKVYRNHVDAIPTLQLLGEGDSKSRPPYAVRVLFNDYLEKRQADYSAKQTSSAALAGQIKKIGETNTQLMHQANDLTGADAIKVANDFYQTASPVWKTVDDAFATQH
ncbi:hypothetical protein [Rhodanobacter ginsengiterrae]|uniref:hypothetical protein n=1 Tax=Rhodanobacter ginsengiterrae TaxID=2008451 RepID=UPI003CFBB2F6